MNCFKLFRFAKKIALLNFVFLLYGFKKPSIKLRKLYIYLFALTINFWGFSQTKKTTKAEDLYAALQNHFKQNNKDSVQFYTKKIFSLHENEAHDSIKVMAASVFSHLQKNNDKAFTYFNIIEKKLLNSNKNKNLLGWLYLFKGSRYYENFYDKEALTFFLKSDSLYQAIDRKSFMSVMALNGICEVLMRSKSNDSSLKISQVLPYINRGYQISDSLNFPVPKAIFLYKKGELMFEQDSLSKSENYFKKSLKVSQQINNNVRIALVYGYLSKIFEKKNGLDSALIYQKRAVLTTKKIEDPRVIMTENLRLGYLYNIFKEYDKAIKYLLFAKKIFKNIVVERKEAKHSIEFELAKSYFGKKEYKKGYNYLMKAKLIMEEIQLARNKDRVNELEAKYQTEKKEREIQLLKSEKELTEKEKVNQRNILVGGIVVLSLIGLLLFFLYKNNKKTTKTLQELNKNKSNFFANVSHEIRTPLTLIKGYTEELNENNKREENIKLNINKQILSITEMVNSVLDLAKIQSSSFKIYTEKTDINLLIKKIFTSFEPLFKQKNIEFILENSLTYSVAKVDKTLFEKAINNLIINALKYTEKGHVIIKTTNKENFLIISISDTGLGIHPNKIKNIFNRFYQVNNDINKAGGSGIGLAFSKEIIEFHGGKISVNSTPNVGSSFKVYIPFIKTDNVTKTVEKNTLKVINTKRKLKFATSNINFLIVDDNADMRNYLVKTLSDFKCYEAENGFNGLEIIENNDINFIITDYMMPKLNGLDFIKQCKTRGYNIPTIMLTAKTDIDSKLEVLQLGIEDYLTKPFNKNELLIRINNLLKNDTERKKHNTETYKNTTNEYDDDFITKLKDYIYKNASNAQLNQGTIINTFGISKSTLYRKVKTETGLKPTEFIKEVKLLKAQQILHNNKNILLKQLALEVGFSHTSYFSKIYEKRFGKKPIEK